MAKKIVETPLMKQYVEMKAKHPDAILLFRVGDFYETFSDDAITASDPSEKTCTVRLPLGEAIAIMSNEMVAVTTWPC